MIAVLGRVAGHEHEVAHAQGRGAQDSLTMGAIAAAEVISHYGARPEADIAALVKARLG